MKKIIINKWDRFGLLTILKEVKNDKIKRYFKCKCDCWKEKEIMLNSLARWNTKSCWCLKLKVNWDSIKNRHFYQAFKNATNRTKIKYKWIKILWENYWDFKKDMYNGYVKHVDIYWKNNTTLERIDNTWNYFNDNCKWITKDKQAINKNNLVMIEYNWKTQAVAEWCRELWVNYNMVKRRIQLWWDKIEALTKPKKVF